MQALDFTPATDEQALYSAHHGWLQSWLHRKLGNAFDAADLAQETFVRLLQRRRTTEGYGDEPRALLTHIAKGLLIDQWRRQEVEQAYLDAIDHHPEQHMPSEEMRLLVLDALCRIESMLRDLPEKTQQIFLMAQLDGLKYAEIADQIGMALITVKRHMRTAFLACMMTV
ncbi:sigma-70 family RNA polymerase sigma factor [Oxalicibacterium faecigallinarum]|nr:sigma-70 family RNA polymerase sigma factor [Oxalicibacterium faecigallinarum]